MNPVRTLKSRITQINQHLSSLQPTPATTLEMPSTSSLASASSSPAPGPAPWRAPFLKNVTEMTPPLFTLATLHSPFHPPTAPSSSSSSSSSTVPRIRTVVFRGMWASLPANPKNPAALNPPLYETDLLTLTTDARMAKVPDLLGSSSATSGAGAGADADADADADAGPPASGGGGPVEACFWTDAKVQWRLRGEAYVLGPDISSPTGPATLVRERLLSHMRKSSSSSSSSSADETNGQNETTHPNHSHHSHDHHDDGQKEWSFDTELTAHFGNLSPAMRGSFRNPPPGALRPKTDPAPADPLRPGQEVEDLHDAVARANFRVVVVVPSEVDRTDLSDPADHRRWVYRFVGGGGGGGDDDDAEGSSNGWEEIEVWP